MRIRLIMNKHSKPEQEDPEQQATPLRNESPQVMAGMSTSVGLENPETASQVEREVDPVDQASQVELPEVPLWAGAERKENLRDQVAASFATLVHRPTDWPALNLRLKDKGAKDVLFGVEDVIKARGPAAVREQLAPRIQGCVDADVVWSLHQPLLSLLLFILRGTNDIHKKLIKVPDLKTDICAALDLGAPTKVKTPAPKPEAVHPVKKLKRITRLPFGGASGDEAGPPPPVIKRLIIRQPGEKRALEEAAGAAAGGPFGPGLAQGPPAKKRKTEGGLGTTGGESALGSPSGLGLPLAPFFKKSERVKKPSVAKLEGATGSLPPSSREQSGPKKHRPKAAATGTETQPRQSAAVAGQAFAFQAGQSQREYLEDAEIVALVQALRARGARDVATRDAVELAAVEERVGELEVQQRAIQAQLAHLKAERRAMVQQRLGHVAEQGVAAPVRAAREKCLQAIVELLDVLPPALDLNAVAVFAELEATAAFDATLGALVSKQRAYLQRNWERKNALAAEAKRAGVDAIRKKDNVRQHLGILAASTTGETWELDVVFSAFQMKLIELRRDMEQRVSLLADREKEARQAWLVYKAALQLQPS